MTEAAAVPAAAREGAPVLLEVSIRREEVLRLLGYPEGRAPSASTEATLEVALAEARRLARARGLFVRLPASAAPAAGLDRAAAETLVLGLATAGGEIETRAGDWAVEGRVSAALVLDAAGSAAAEEAADRLCARILAGNDGAGSLERAACRVSPGYGDWPLSAQTRVFELLPSALVGVRLLPSLLMVPRKSVSFAMWLDAGGLPIPGLSGCERCPLERCEVRRGRTR